MESVWNPFGILTEQNRTEQKRTEQNRTEQNRAEALKVILSSCGQSIPKITEEAYRLPVMRFVKR